ncbi:MAG TPA: phenylalanine--tRNA ligase subunit beta [Dongiaceae bacterium]|nr:phenylalanine--tRNA ligase subunit beta [Dongiaceae bacterium]
MIISVNWLKKFTQIDGKIDELATLIGARLVEIEKVIDLGAKYQGVVVAKVVECGPLEGSDHLNVTKIDDGGVVPDVERDENGLVQVVCGAPNVRADLTVAWLPPKSIVPETYGDAEPFVLGAKPLRGVMSNGMLASARELDLYDDHTGIIEIDKEAAPGTSFAELYELNDYLLDIENKSLTHRPDAFGVVGFAREVAGIQGLPFHTPEWLQVIDAPVAQDDSVEAPTITIEDPTLSDRFQAIALSGVDETAKSPVQLQTYLARSGVRPINASVDVSNYLMLLTGQPSHTYDYDKVKAVAGDDFTIRVRLAREGEKLVLLDGKEVTLDAADIVIAAGETAIGLAGIMGGQNTIVDGSTKRVLFEAATFDLYHMRSSQMRHGIFSEAVTRFTKGIPAPLSTPVLVEAVQMLHDQTGANAASPVVQDYPGKREPIIVRVSEKQINQTLGTHFSAEDIAELLQNVGFGVTFEGLEAVVVVPYWRQDIHIAEDIVEEVGRLAGFDTINLTLPRRDFVAVRPSTFDELRMHLRKRLVRAGANEVLTYSFVHGDILKKAGQATDNAYRIVNSISPDLQYYRQSLTPSLLSAVFANVKAGYESFALFEANKVHQKSEGLNDESVPVEHDSLALVVTHAKKDGAAYYEAKRTLEYALNSLGVTNLVFSPLETTDAAVAAPFEPKRSAVVIDAKNDTALGIVGEYKQSVRKAFKLPEYTAGFELDPRNILQSLQALGIQYRPLSRYPGTERDVCFQVGEGVTYNHVVEPVLATLADTKLISSVSPVDIYQPENSDTKNITVRIALASYEKTMTNEEVTATIDDIIVRVVNATGGKVI